MMKDMLEMAKICVKWLNHLRNGLNMWELTSRFGKWLRYMVLALSI